jgi:hypothetical protein
MTVLLLDEHDTTVHKTFTHPLAGAHDVTISPFRLCIDINAQLER